MRIAAFGDIFSMRFGDSLTAELGHDAAQRQAEHTGDRKPGQASQDGDSPERRRPFHECIEHRAPRTSRSFSGFFYCCRNPLEFNIIIPLVSRSVEHLGGPEAMDLGTARPWPWGRRLDANPGVAWNHPVSPGGGDGIFFPESDQRSEHRGPVLDRETRPLVKAAGVGGPRSGY